MSPWEQIASLARLAPTPHNTQPFRIRPRGDDRADLVLLTERLLPEEDHGNLYVASSFGTFAVALERAGRHFGIDLEITPVADLALETLPELGPRVVLGEARVRGSVPAEPAAQALDARRTSRLPYQDRLLAPEVRAALVTVVERSGHRLLVHDAPEVVGPLLRLNASAIIDNLQLSDERKEIRGWHRLGKTPAFGDGLWQEPMNQPAWELWSAFAMPWLFRLPGFRQFAARRYLTTQRGTRQVALLCGAFRRWPELYAAGRMLMELWLEMARHDVYMQPMGSMLTNPRYVAEIARRFACDDCWLVLRLGHSAVPPRAPRLQNIVLSDE
ncbi:MAG TPA: hypothetical protein VGP07_00435 [Polyangia bacterium]|jgi:nitroreductase